MPLLFITDFMEMHFADILDIILVALLLFYLYRLMRGTAAINIFIGIVAIYFVWKLVKLLQMDMLSEILGQFVSVGVIVLVVVFQREIRQFLLMIGSPRFLTGRQRWKAFWKMDVRAAYVLDIEHIVDACKQMSSEKTGALIVIARKNDLSEFVNTGEVLDARISDELIQNIFFKNSPLHDGALIIIKNRIRAARCILPLTRGENFPASYGLRHRAAAGISEMSDAIAIIVSEQTGDIAYSKNGTLFTKIKAEALKIFLETEFSI